MVLETETELSLKIQFISNQERAGRRRGTLTALNPFWDEKKGFRSTEK
jgi:hypothetical protein